MEDEAFFLNVCYTLEAELSEVRVNEKTQKNYTYQGYIVRIKRATMHRREQDIGRDKISRVKIDFDALGKQVAFAVIVTGEKPCEGDPSMVVGDVVRACGVFLEQEKAEQLRNEIELANGKGFLVKKEKFDRVFVEPVLISQN